MTGLLEVNCIGEIFRGGKKAKLYNHSAGYSVVNFNCGTHLVHRLVAEKYLHNPLGKKTVNHKDGVRKNNRFSNLEWATYGENNTHSYRVLGKKSGMLGVPSVNRKKCVFINKKSKEEIVFDSKTEAAKYFNAGNSTIHLWISKKQNKTHICHEL